MSESSPNANIYEKFDVLLASLRQIQSNGTTLYVKADMACRIILIHFRE